MTTPTCRTCGTKFPGREVCKECGADPNAVPSEAIRFKHAVRRAVATAPHLKPTKATTRAIRRSIENKPRKRGHGRQS